MPVPDAGRECPFFFTHYMYVNGLVEFWGGLGYFGVVLSVSMDSTTVMLTDQIRKRVCLAP